MVVYVGKAKNLRRRLGQYRNARRLKAHWKMREILKAAVSLDWEELSSEGEALLRELSIIQELRPRFNEASTFFDYYPLVGWKPVGTGGRICFVLTTRPGFFTDFELHGAFRSSGRTNEAFLALERLLRRVARPLPRTQLWSEGLLRGRSAGTQGFVVGGLPQEWLEKLSRFFRGQSSAAMEDLLLTILDQGQTRFATRSAATEDFKALKRFWLHEALPLRRVLDRLPADYPVPQRARDGLFLQARGRAPLIAVSSSG